MNKSYTFLFHKTLKNFKEQSIQNKKMIVGVSGGLDSIVLMRLLQELSSVCKLEFLISYIHHGPANDKKTQDYRDKAHKLISQTCEKNKLLFFSSKSKKRLKSEEEFRNFRHREFKKLLKQEKANLIVLAHNQNDLLETRLINLIRGSGRQGLNSMKFYQTPYLRPLLNFSREEIKKYAKTCKLNFLEDPSNKDTSYLRNWIRRKWLKDLEKKRSGSLKSLARSLELLSHSSASKSYNSHSVRNFHEKRNFPIHNNKNKGDTIGKSEAGKRNNNKEITRTDGTKIKAEEKITAEKGISFKKKTTRTDDTKTKAEEKITAEKGISVRKKTTRTDDTKIKAEEKITAEKGISVKKKTTRTDDTKIKAEEKITAEKGISVRKKTTRTDDTKIKAEEKITAEKGISFKKKTTRTDDTKIKAEEKITAEKEINVRKEITKLVTSKGINRKLFLELSLEDQKRVLASYMRRLKFSNYGQSHIQELIKHNKRTEKNFQIKLLKKTWLFTQDKITIK